MSGVSAWWDIHTNNDDDGEFPGQIKGSALQS